MPFRLRKDLLKISELISNALIKHMKFNSRNALPYRYLSTNLESTPFIYFGIDFDF